MSYIRDPDEELVKRARLAKPTPLHELGLQNLERELEREDEGKVYDPPRYDLILAWNDGEE